MSPACAHGCVPATAARSPCAGRARATRSRSWTSSVTASPMRRCTPVAISITAACVSSVTRSRSSAGRAASTSSDRNASDQRSGSRSMNSSSMPIVSSPQDGRVLHAAHAGTLVTTGPPSERGQSRAEAVMPAGAVVAVAGETRAGTHSVGAVRGRRDMGSFLGVARAALPAAVGSRRRSESPLARAVPAISTRSAPRLDHPTAARAPATGGTPGSPTAAGRRTRRPPAS